ncbi:MULTISPECIES: cbb3-type cytochrome oxidase assembly protein CcoS [Bosea]|jgi:cbb3-type cytochrome oxidase maturation protein|uniref:Cbb3-type cytochrome oxidase assembly protein CcoS n=1 Tax=Bosea rubneri TaxID=3075434 RepID=A0ABU3S1G1_9HYPH|nr:MULTISPECIES: cbb3-type cytochrome oxidase assembly protein CcoS [unclassified Bosea (in: a-proteobacteria)]MDU0338531.1 cbb3-type cytochrome oxidase assembly protein CcoS [Bosea sp. ZW T0_25]HEV7336295.1 cbb3-type cytochrome oxidase assembly protein CcoS [Bosea sp. (in: a-proteobacteria)]
MSPLLFLIPIALTLGALGVVAFLWTLRSGQYDDLDGAAERIFLDDDRLEASHDR